jgi:hypothetical protein
VLTLYALRTAPATGILAQAFLEADELSRVDPCQLDQKLSPHQTSLAVINHVIHHVVQAVAWAKSGDDRSEIRALLTETPQFLSCKSGKQQPANGSDRWILRINGNS